MLKIEADAGSVDAVLRQTEAGVRRVDAAVKVGNRTLKARVTTEGELVAALSKFEAAEIRAMTAGQRRAAASLAAQKSAALLKRMLDEEREAERKLGEQKAAAASLARQKSAALLEQMRAEERATAATKKATEAERASAAASLARQKSAAIAKRLLDAEQESQKRASLARYGQDTMRRAAIEAEEATFRRQQRRLADMTQAQEVHRGSLRRGASAALSFAGSITGIGSAAAAATALIAGLRVSHEHAMDMAKRSDKAAAGLKEFIALQAEGEEGRAFVKDTVLKGAAVGLTAEEVGAIAQPIQSVVDEDGDGRLNEQERAKFDEDFAAAGRLRKTGVSANDAQTVITSGRTKGIGGTEASDKLTRAADLSAAGPADFARSASAMGQFADQDTALATVVALTKEEKNFEQIPTLVRGAAKVLGAANDDSKFSRKFGLAGLTEAEKIQKLRDEGAQRGEGATEEERIASFSRSFRNEGLDEEAARAMGILVRQSDTVASSREEISNVESGLTERKVAALAEDPLAGSLMRSEQAAALAEANTLYGSEADKSREKRAAALERGAELNEAGASWATTPEGEAQAWYDPRRLFAEFMMSTMPGANAAVGGKTPEGASAQEKQIAAMESLNKSLQENTAATQANSASSKGKTPVGGAASNAEEKY